MTFHTLIDVSQHFVQVVVSLVPGSAVEGAGSAGDTGARSVSSGSTVRKTNYGIRS